MEVRISPGRHRVKLKNEALNFDELKVKKYNSEDSTLIVENFRV